MASMQEDQGQMAFMQEGSDDMCHETNKQMKEIKMKWKSKQKEEGSCARPPLTSSAQNKIKQTKQRKQNRKQNKTDQWCEPRERESECSSSKRENRSDCVRAKVKSEEEEEAVRACKGWAVKELLFGEEEIDQISARDLLPSPKWCPSCLNSTSDLACKLGREILLLSSLEELLSPLGSAAVIW